MIDVNVEDGRDPVECLAEEFAERKRRGETPTIDEYAKKYPELSERIRFLFPVLTILETEPEKPSVTHPTHLGEYQILREIGRGGMGVVYEALQTSLGRHVAVKMLSAHAKTDQRDRFIREARIAGRLHHSHIVSVYGVGTKGDDFYFVMQLIDGTSFDRILKHLKLSQPELGKVSTILARTEANTKVSQLPTTRPVPQIQDKSGLLPHLQAKAWSQFDYVERCRAVAKIGAQIADALAYSHEQGVVHRDVKPSNILLDNSGHPWLSDFGLARGEESDLTATGELMGTLRYLAPERLHGKSGPASDLFSLGATLYEMISLQQLHSGASHAELVKQIQQDEPVPLAILNRRTPADLDTIIMKCLAKDPKQRYSTAAELSRDLYAFLNDEPIRAKPLLWWEKTWRWMKRNPVVAGLSLALLAMLMGGLITVTALYLRSEEHRIDAEIQKESLALERNQVREQRDLARTNLEIAINAVDRFYVDVSELLVDQPGFEAIRDELLRDATQFHQALMQHQPNDSVELLQYVQALELHARAQGEWGKLSDALPLAEKAVEMLKKHLDFTNLTYRQSIVYARAQLRLANHYRHAGKRSEGFACMQEAAQTLDQISQSAERSISFDETSFALNNGLAMHFYRELEETKAEAYFKKAMETIKRMIDSHPTVHRYKHTWSQLVNQYASLLTRCKQDRNSIQLREECIARLKKFEKDPSLKYSAERDISRLLSSLAHDYSGVNEPDKSDALFKEVKLQQTREVEQFPKAVTPRAYLANSYRLHGYALLARNKWADAIVEFSMAEILYQQLLGKDTDNEGTELLRFHALTTQSDKARAYMQLREYHTAASKYEAVCEGWKAHQTMYPQTLNSEKWSHFGGSLNNLAICYLQTGRYEQAEKRYRQAIEVQTQALGIKPVFNLAPEYMANHHSGLVTAFRVQGKNREALDQFDTFWKLPVQSQMSLISLSKDMCHISTRFDPDSEAEMHQRCIQGALASLKKAVEMKYSNAAALETEPAWEPIRSLPEFQHMIANMKKVK